MNDSRRFRGKKFNCSFAWLLERYKLSGKYALKEQIKVKFPGHPKFVFVTAASAKYFPSLRMLIANIKQQFGCRQKIIAYDLENVTKNTKWMAQLNSVCELEWRIFDFSQLVNGRVRHLHSYSWKIFVIADVLSEFDTVAWVDTSIFFGSNNLSPILAPIQKGQIGPVQMPSNSHHGMNIATHPGMYEYLPLFTNFEPTKTNKWTGNDPPQFESNFVILHKSEQTRQLMKWYYLT
ncbi:hypothetical protein niasHT_036892 [Heterodera trifolii]|uniref:Nucleotide-diphospho-sugar transferase domain-containing protein n=1 Tax=Heterodera trifolii TaxID=157864 RepID=A0ABD2IE86_9BILA